MNLKLLKRWVNDIYLNPETLQQARASYEKSAHGSLRLHSLLKPAVYHKIETKAMKMKGKQVKIPDRFSYSEVKMKELENFFSSREFISLISFIAGRKIKKAGISTKKFGHRNYTLLHDSEQMKPSIDIFFDIIPIWDSNWGGSIVYRNAGQELFRMLPVANSLTIVDRKKRMYRFVEYVNHKAGKNAQIVVEGLLE